MKRREFIILLGQFSRLASDQGLPIGMQIIGPYLEDRTPLTFAALMEGEFGGFVAPPAFKG
jgi:amidase